MSTKRFLEALQALLTMVDPDSPTSIACVTTALENIYALARESGLADAYTLRIMDSAIRQIKALVLYKHDFAGKPNDYSGNKARQARLENMLRPGC